MKKLIIAIIISIITSSLSIYGQSNISIDNLITKIKSNKKNITTVQKTPVLIQKDFFNQTLVDYEILRANSTNFRILSKNNNKIIFQVVRINGHTQGIALETDKAYGYLISDSPTSDHLIFSKTSKNNLVYVCGTPNQNKTISTRKEQHTETVKKRPIGNSDTTTNPLLLESRPGATHLIYLDYDGESKLPGWESKPFIATASNVPDNEKRKIWKAIAEDFLPFDVNITNNRRLYDNHPALTKGWVVFANFNKPGWLGVAQKTYGSGTPVLVHLPSDYSDDHRYLYTVPSHELGHGFGLDHDGNPTDGEYYKGHGEYTPIMGNGVNTVSHWSKGEYAGATNLEDDIEIIKKSLTYATDDYTDNHPLAIVNNTVDPKQNFGFIGTRSDTDTFSINLESNADIILTISSPLETFTNLDIKATLTDSNGNLLQTSSPIGDRNAYINMSVPKGTYYLEIDGVGELTVNDGFSDYSSLGYYEISGRAGYISPNSDFSYSNKNLCAGTTVTFDNLSLGTDGVYEWSFEGGDINTSTNKNPTVTYADAGLYNVQLKTSNTTGSNIRQKKIHIGGQNMQIKFATEKLNTALTGSIRINDEIVSFTYNDLQDLDKETAHYDICLLEKCYDIILNNTYNLETCGTPIWKNRTAYNGGDLVYYNHHIYQARWWTNNHPTDSNFWTKKQECIPTDENNTIQIVDNNNSIIFETNPKEVGIDSFIKKQFCNGVPLSNTDFTKSDLTYNIYPNPTDDILNIEGGHIDTITVINSNGSTLGKYIVNDTDFKLNTINYSNGIYFIAIVSNTTKTIKKFSKL